MSKVFRTYSEAVDAFLAQGSYTSAYDWMADSDYEYMDGEWYEVVDGDDEARQWPGHELVGPDDVISEAMTADGFSWEQP